MVKCSVTCMGAGKSVTQTSGIVVLVGALSASLQALKATESSFLRNFTVTNTKLINLHLSLDCPCKLALGEEYRV